MSGNEAIAALLWNLMRNGFESSVTLCKIKFLHSTSPVQGLQHQQLCATQSIVQRHDQDPIGGLITSKDMIKQCASWCNGYMEQKPSPNVPSVTFTLNISTCRKPKYEGLDDFQFISCNVDGWRCWQCLIKKNRGMILFEDGTALP